jgi:hypothetical protein
MCALLVLVTEVVLTPLAVADRHYLSGRRESMIKHLPFNEFDMCAITNAVSCFKGAGLLADYNMEQKAGGVVSILFENPTNHIRAPALVVSWVPGSDIHCTSFGHSSNRAKLRHGPTGNVI